MDKQLYSKFLKSKRTERELEDIEEQRARRAVISQPGKVSGHVYRLAPNPFTNVAKPERKKDESGN